MKNKHINIIKTYFYYETIFKKNIKIKINSNLLKRFFKGYFTFIVVNIKNEYVYNIPLVIVY